MKLFQWIVLMEIKSTKVFPPTFERAGAESLFGLSFFWMRKLNLNISKLKLGSTQFCECWTKAKNSFSLRRWASKGDSFACALCKMSKWTSRNIINNENAMRRQMHIFYVLLLEFDKEDRKSFLFLLSRSKKRKVLIQLGIEQGGITQVKLLSAKHSYIPCTRETWKFNFGFKSFQRIFLATSEWRGS